jgi:hypothetical protein
MGSFSDFLEAKLLNHVWGNTAMSVSGTMYVGLATASINDAITGITVVEPPTNSGGNPTAYARVAVTNNTTNFPNATGTSPTTKNNGTAINFAQCSTNWGTCTDFFFADTPNVATGSILGWGTLTTAKTISSGDSASFAINAITITLD